MEYFYADESAEFRFMQAPAFLFSDSELSGLSNASKLLYILLLDRTKLSKKNKWVDKDGSIFVYFTVNEAREKLGIGKQKAISSFKELEDIGLIKRIHQGLGKPRRIKVKYLNDSENKTVSKTEPESTENQNPGISKTEPQEFRIPNPNNNKINKKYSSNINYIYHSEEDLKENIKEDIGYEWLINVGHKKEIIDLITEIIYEVNYGNCESYRISGSTLSSDNVKERFKEIDSSIVEYVSETTEKAQKESVIKNLKSYLRTSLYNAPLTIDSYYENQVKLMSKKEESSSYNPGVFDPYKTDYSSFEFGAY